MTRSCLPIVARADEPLLLLHFAFRAVVAEPDARLAALGLSRVHHRVLFFVARRPGLRVMDLAATLGISKQALHRPLQQLLQQKLVVAGRDPQNRRERHLRLSASGRRLEHRLSGHQRRLFRAAFRQVGPRAARAWATVMLQLAEQRTPLTAA
jgi:DNA-binding MarR family transcriptional regulator